MRILLALAAILLGLTALSFAGACAEQKDPAPPNIIFVLIDTLRADHLPSYGFRGTSTPALDRIAREGVLFERVIAPSSFTKTSMASIFTSRDPDRHGPRHRRERGRAAPARDVRDGPALRGRERPAPGRPE